MVSYNLEKDNLSDIFSCLENATGPQIRELIVRLEEVDNILKTGFARAANAQAAAVFSVLTNADR